MAIVPPPVIEQRLAALVPRVRALRAIRGASLLMLVAVGSLAAVALLDAAFPLPAWARGLAFSAGVTGAGVLAWRWVLVPLRAEVSLAEIAEELAKHLPELGERLRAVAGAGESPSSIRAALAEDTARRARAIDFRSAIPLKPAARLAGGAAVAVLAVSALAFVEPESFRRVVLPWSRTFGPSSYYVHVTSESPVVRRGGPVTLSAYPKRIGSGEVAPLNGKGAFLFVRDGAGGAGARHEMTPGPGGEFHATLLAVAGDFEYCVELGGVRSDWVRVAALDAVELAAGTQVEITPPAYANTPEQARDGFTGFSALQHSTAEFRLKFNRPAAAVHLDWRPDGAAAGEGVPVALAPDRLGASATFRVRQSGALRLTLMNEERGHRLATETPVSVRAAPDAPPRFEQLAGVTARPRAARPDERVRVEFAARDDGAVTAAALEYIPGAPGAKPVSIPVALEHNGPDRAAGGIDFPLAGLCGEGETIRYRVRVWDNRALDEPKLIPQEAVFPPAGWSELRIDSAASPLALQEVTCQGDALGAGIAVAVKEVKSAASEVEVLRTEAGGALEVHHQIRFNTARERLRDATSALLDSARDAALTPELRPLAEALRALAEQALKAADNSLRIAETDEARLRKASLELASGKLGAALASLDELRDRNAKVARHRLDRAKLLTLAADQAKLAGAKPDPDRIAKQKELLERLEEVIAGSDPLRAAADASRGGEVRSLTRATRELLERLRALDAAARQTSSEARAVLVAAIEREQAALAKRTVAAYAKLETPCRLAGVAPPAENFPRVAELAGAGKTIEALAELERHAQSLDRGALAFEKWGAERADPKFAAKQLAQWQADLLARVRAAKKDGVLPALVRAALLEEQKVLAAAVESLNVPSDFAIKSLRDDAVSHARVAANALADGKAPAEVGMKFAEESLGRLAETTPPVAERLTQSLRALEPLRVELETTTNAVELALKKYERQPPDAAAPAVAKKLAPEADRQRKLAAGVESLDLPGFGARQARAVRALRTAVRDLEDGSPFDVLASQLGARREFDRLKLAIEANPAPDSKAEGLFHALAALADSLDLHGPMLTAKQLEPAALVVREASRQLTGMAAPESPSLLNEARYAVQHAEGTPRDAPPGEVRRRIRAAADAVGKLSDRLNGFESDFDRVNRLAMSRRFAAEKPKELFASDEGGRQLAREVEELAHTRVGAAGQILKKRALDLYAKLRAKNDPDRLGSHQKSLIVALDELAAKMSDVNELATVEPRPAAPAPPEADQFLPSKTLADAARALLTEQGALRAAVANLAPELANRLKPSLFASPGRSVLGELERLEQLAREAGELATRLEGAAKSHPPDDATGQALAEAATAVREVESRLRDSAKRVAAGNAEEAARFRAAAGNRLIAAGEKLVAASPAGPDSATGDALRAAERAMRRALDALAEGGDPLAANRAVQGAAKSLREAAESAGK